MKAVFLPSTLDMAATTGITTKVVIKAPTHPCSAGQTPNCDSSELNRWCKMMKNVNVAMTLKELKTRKVANAIFRNCGIAIA